MHAEVAGMVEGQFTYVSLGIRLKSFFYLGQKQNEGKNFIDNLSRNLKAYPPSINNEIISFFNKAEIIRQISFNEMNNDLISLIRGILYYFHHVQSNEKLVHSS